VPIDIERAQRTSGTRDIVMVASFLDQAQSTTSASYPVEPITKNYKHHWRSSRALRPTRSSLRATLLTSLTMYPRLYQIELTISNWRKHCFDTVDCWRGRGSFQGLAQAGTSRSCARPAVWDVMDRPWALLADLGSNLVGTRSSSPRPKNIPAGRSRGGGFASR